jgi:urea transport system permease protein
MLQTLLHRLLIMLAALSACSAAYAQTPEQGFAEQVQALPAADYADKQQIVARLAASPGPQTKAVLTALMGGRLYARTGGGVVIVDAADAEKSEGLKVTDAVSGASAGTANADQLEKVSTNNQIRKSLRQALAQFALQDPDRAIRLAAVNEMVTGLDDATVDILRIRQAKETDSAVRDQIVVALALHDLDGTDAAQKTSAVQLLGKSLNRDVYNRLTELAGGDATGSDADLIAAAKGALRSIDRRRSLYSSVETLFFGLSLGSVLVLSAIGLSITFGVMGVINMAHGELMMLGAYATYVVQQLMPGHIAASIVVAIPVAFLVAALAGIAIERGIVRYLYGRPLETLLATFGVSLILQQVVRDVFSANNRPIETPAWLAGSMQINEVLSITYVRLYIVVFTLAVFCILLMVLRYTRLGLEVRAVSQNRAMARAMGIRTEWVDALTFGLGSGIAGVAGVALSQLTNVGPNLGQSYIVDSFMVVVFGGVDNLWGTLVSGLSLGVINKLLEPFAGAVLAKIFVLVFLILFIQRKPRGLFPQKGRAAEN